MSLSEKERIRNLRAAMDTLTDGICFNLRPAKFQKVPGDEASIVTKYVGKNEQAEKSLWGYIDGLPDCIKKDIVGHFGRLADEYIPPVTVTKESLILLEKFGDTDVEHAAAAGLFTTYSAHGMTMEEAISITSASSNEEVVKAMEKWVAEHGGMDRILEKNLSDALFDKPVVRSEFNSRRLHLLTMKEGEYGPLPVHPGIVAKQAERLHEGFNVTEPKTSEGDVITETRVMLETGMVLHLAKRKDGWPTVYCCDKDGNVADVVRLGVQAGPEDWFTLNDRFYDDQGFMKPQRIPEGMTLVELQSEHRQLLMAKGEPAESACSPTTQDVITPKGVSQVWKADLETAKRLAEIIIRPNKDGLEINYGRLALGHLEGIPFLAEVEDIEKAELRCIYISRIPKFQQHLKLLVSWGSQEEGELQPNVVHDREATVYVLEKEDLAQLGAILSKNGRYVRAVYRGCFLQTWSNGFIYAPYRPATDFFVNLTEEEIEEAKF